MIRKFHIISILLLGFVLGGCQNFDSTLDYAYEDPIQDGGRTLIVYLAMNNSLSQWDIPNLNINGLRSGVSEKALANGRVVIYKADKTLNPLLLEIKLNEAGVAYVDTLKRYGAQNSAQTAVLRKVIDDAKTLAPGRSYAMIFGSHASGWMPSSSGRSGFQAMKGQAPMIERIADPKVDSDGRPLTRTVLDESVRSTYMSLSDFAATLHDNEFDYIVFDACHMGEVEVVYALRNKTRWVVASPAEMLIDGMPYNQIVGDLMAPTPRLVSVCRKYYNFYNTSSEPSAVIGLYDCSKIEALAASMKNIVAANRSNIRQMTTSNLQRYDQLWKPITMFDIADFVDKLVPATSDPLKADFTVALSKVVVYKAATKSIVRVIPVTTCCGISSYIPTDAMGAALNDYYMQTDWAKKVYAE